MTEATVTSAPQRVRVSVMQVVSISSLPSAIGTRTRLDISTADEDKEAEAEKKRGERGANDCVRVGANAKNAVRTRAILRMQQRMREGRLTPCDLVRFGSQPPASLGDSGSFPFRNMSRSVSQ